MKRLHRAELVEVSNLAQPSRDPNTQEIALSALTGGRGVLCVYMLGLMTLQLTLGPSMVAIGVEADWAKSDPTGPHP